MASPENLALKEQLRSAPPLAGELADWREAVVKAASQFQSPPGIRREKARAGGVDAEWFRHDGSSGGVLLYLHGGGYMLCSTDSHHGLIGELAIAARVDALGVNYRLAPEHPFPAAVDDAVAAYKYLLDAGYRPERIAVAGDSAGGGLAAALLLAAKEQGLPQPACAVLMSPWTDLSLSLPTMQANAQLDPLCDEASLSAMAAGYLAGRDARQPLASPLFGDWSGAPPMHILVGSHEVLLDDSLQLAKTARAAGVEVKLEVGEECIHVYPMYSQAHPEGAEAVEHAGAFMREKLGI
jgi:acetyl esterase/lipase